MDCKPKLRFPEFSDEWEEKKLGDIVKTQNSKYNPEKDDTNYKCVELEHLSQNTGKLLGFCDSKEQNSIKNKFKSGNVLFGKLRPYLKKYWHATFDGACSTEIWVLNGKNVTNEFLYQLIQTHKFDYIANISSGSKMPRSDWKYMRDVNFNIPSFSEQQKIASFLSKVDSKIDLLEKKQELWETYKKGIMQQIFSQKLRFKDENGEDYPNWRTKKLGRIARFLKGKGISKEDISRDGVECIRYGELYTTYKEEIRDITSKTNLNVDDLVLSVENDVIIPTSGETAIDIATASCVMKSGVAIGGDTTIIKTNENGLFISYCLNSQRNKIARLAQGVSVVHLYSSQLKELELEIPTIEEQNKIAHFLSVIEIRTRHVKKELEINKEFKKGLLQQMFC